MLEDNKQLFRDYMLAFLFLRYLSNNYEAAVRRELAPDYPKLLADDIGIANVSACSDGLMGCETPTLPECRARMVEAKF